MAGAIIFIVMLLASIAGVVWYFFFRGKAEKEAKKEAEAEAEALADKIADEEKRVADEAAAAEEVAEAEAEAEARAEIEAGIGGKCFYSFSETPGATWTLMCPKTAPNCVGFVLGATRGTCRSDDNPGPTGLGDDCIQGFGEDGASAEYTCPETAPKCVGHAKLNVGHRYGACGPVPGPVLETEPVLVNQSETLTAEENACTSSTDCPETERGTWQDNSQDLGGAPGECIEGLCVYEQTEEETEQENQNTTAMVDADYNDIIWPNRWKNHEVAAAAGQGALTWHESLALAGGEARASYRDTIGNTQNVYWANPFPQEIPRFGDWPDERYLTGDALKAKATKIQNLEGCMDDDYYEYDAKYTKHDPTDCMRWNPVVGKTAYRTGYCTKNYTSGDQNDHINSNFKESKRNTESDCLDWCSMRVPWTCEGDYASCKPKDGSYLDGELWNAAAVQIMNHEFNEGKSRTSPMTACEWKPTSHNNGQGGECTVHTSQVKGASGSGGHRCYIRKTPEESSAGNWS